MDEWSATVTDHKHGASRREQWKREQEERIAAWGGPLSDEEIVEAIRRMRRLEVDHPLPDDDTDGASRLPLHEAFDLRYHVPRSQVWEGSRGKQRGNVHLYVKEGEAFVAGRIHRVEHQTLCGRRAWYARPLQGNEGQREDEFCPRCVEIGTRSNGRLSGLVAA